MKSKLFIFPSHETKYYIIIHVQSVYKQDLANYLHT